MKERIIQEIAALEQQKNIKVLYAVESGSRAWGFPSADSDWDVRCIYIHRPEWYLSIDDGKDNFEQMLPHDIDVAGWEIRKALKLFRKSNPPLLEWLQSPCIYTIKTPFTERLKAAGEMYFNPRSCMYHYLHMASRNWETYFKEDTARIKKYFYVLRPVMACLWIMHNGNMPPTEFQKLFDAAQMPHETRREINELLEQKKSGAELSKGKRIKVIDHFLEEKMAAAKDYLKQYDFTNYPDKTILNTIFRTALEEAWN